MVLETGESHDAQPPRASLSAVLFGTPWKTGPIATFASTVFHGSSASVWNMKLVPRDAGDRPLADADAASLARSTPAIRVSVVDLPQPDGPTTAQKCSGSTVRFTLRSAVKDVRVRRPEALGHPGQLDAPASRGASLMCWIAQASTLAPDVIVPGHYRARSLR